MMKVVVLSLVLFPAVVSGLKFAPQSASEEAQDHNIQLREITAASAEDLKRNQINRTKFQTWHEQLVKAVTSGESKDAIQKLMKDAPANDWSDFEELRTAKDRGMTMGNYACACPIGRTYLYARSKAAGEVYCAKWRSSGKPRAMEPWASFAIGTVNSKCANPTINFANIGMSACGGGKLLCQIADQVVDNAATTKSGKGTTATRSLAAMDVACWFPTPALPAV